MPRHAVLSYARGIPEESDTVRNSASLAFLMLPDHDGAVTSSEVPGPRRPRRVHSDVQPQDLVDARTALGMTLGQLAEAAGISEKTLGAWERGAVVPNRATLGKLKTYLRSRRVTLGSEPRRIGVDPAVQAILDDPQLSEGDKAAMISLLERLRRE